jgi:hypothetical protein
MPKTYAPYLTREPWLPFTPREKPRPCPLAACPSPKCRRAKACISAHDNLYCQRTHESVAAFRARSGIGPTPPRTRAYSDAELEALREDAEARLAEIKAQKRETIMQWKAGVFDQTFGKYRACGVWKKPPNRQYTEG